MTRAGRGAAAVFFLAFGIYLWTMPPTLAPYRDAGEMSASTATLGVSHPPSYPVYVLLGRLSSLLPFATHAFRLDVLSALAGAAALSAVWLALAGSGAAPPAAACLLLAFNSTFWNVCGVQEMYSLTLLFAALILHCALLLRAGYRPRLWLLFCLLYGLSLGNRTDLLLWAPGLLVLAFSARAQQGGLARFAGLSACFVLLGLLVYAYLPLRSGRGPWLDWNHPANLDNFIGSLTRRGYGGTLDLISKNYSPGEMFLPNMKVYALHLWSNFGPAGLLLAAWGLAVSWRSERRRCAGLALLYAASGPAFLYLANMPPNPHALAIVEPHYLLSDIVLAFWAAAALGPPSPQGKAVLRLPRGAAALACAVLALQPWLFGRWAQMDRRWNLIGYDYVHNVMRSAPPGSIVVAKKDVQIFSLWHYHVLEGLRPDVRLLAQGLSHSPWYYDSVLSREKGIGVPVRPGPVRELEEFKAFLARNPGPVLVTTDVELPQGVPVGRPDGLLAPLLRDPAEVQPPPSAAIWEFLVRRGDYRYDRRPDFFTADIIEAYALSLQRLGAAFSEAGQDARARWALLSGWSMKWLLGEAPVYLGFLAYRAGDMAHAAASYEDAGRIYGRLLELTREYHSLPDVKEGISASAADALMNLGVACEKLKEYAKAEAAYGMALRLRPRLAKAHYNLAVLYWNKDWARVVAELHSALAIDPAYPDARRFLALAEAAQRAAGPGPR